MASESPWEHWLTLYTDASWHPDRGGAYGMRVRGTYEPRVFERRGRIDPCQCNVVAEVAAIVISVELSLGAWARVDGIGVNSDCQPALDICAWNAKPHRREDIAGWQVRLREALMLKKGAQGHAPLLRMKWVKGHAGGRDTRRWLNARVDALSKRR